MSREEDLNLQPMVYDTIALPIELSRRRSDPVRLWRKLSYIGMIKKYKVLCRMYQVFKVFSNIGF